MSNVYSYQQIAEHNSSEDIWIVIDGKVYDVTKFMDEHPGGDEIILDLAGQDASEPFRDIGHSEEALKILNTLCVGRVDINSKPVDVETPETSTQGSHTTGGEGSGKLVIACAIVFFIVAYYFANNL